MMIFTRRLRSLYVWILLVGTYIVVLRITDAAFDLVWYDVIAWGLWFLLLGFQLGQTGGWSAGTRRPPGLAAFQLGAVTFLLVGIVGSFVDVTILLGFKSVRPAWWWLVDQGSIAAIIGLTLGLGLQRYCGIGVKRAVAAGLTCFAFEFVPAAVLVAALLSRHMPLYETYHWAAALFFAPCALAALALFDRAFRRISVWLGFAALFTLPYAVFVWLADTGRIAITVQARDSLIIVMASLWVAAIGYWLQHTSPAEATARGASMPSSKAPPASGAVASAAA